MLEDSGIREIFDSLTTKQREVLELVADNRTTKEIAVAVQVSDSAVNQRINALRSRFGGVPRSELARIFRQFSAPRLDTTYQKITGQKLQLPEQPVDEQTDWQDNEAGIFAVADSIPFRIDSPWQRSHIPSVVPRVLDGSNALLSRGALILVTTVAMLLCLVAIVGLAQGVTDIIRR